MAADRTLTWCRALDALPKRMPKAKTGISFVRLDTGESAAPPTEFRIFRAGLNKSRKGNFLFSERSATEVMADAADFEADYPIDFNHSMFGFSMGDPAENGKAAGWFRPEVRNGELWATNVVWSELASDKLTKREYRYISPTFNCKEDGEILELLNVALTNIPALKGLSPLMAHQLSLFDPKENNERPPMFEKLLMLLSLKEGATEAEAFAAVGAVLEDRRKLLSATGKTSISEVLGAWEALSQAAGKAEQISKELAELKGAQRTSEVETLLSTGVKDGKLVPAQVDVMRKKGMEDIEFLKAFLSTAVSVVPGSATEPKEKPQALSDVEIQIAKTMGMSPERAAELKKLATL